MIVTYGEISRLNNLKKSIRQLGNVKEVSNIIVVDNGSQYNVELEIEKLNLPVNINYVLNEKNKGSAGGFYDGIKTAVSCDNEYNYDHIMLLDDDTFVEKDCIENINKVEKTDFPGFKEPHIWALYRQNKYPTTFQKTWDYNINFYINLFGSVSIERKIASKKMKSQRKNQTIACLTTSTYAGLIIPLRTIKKFSIFPDENYYLYVDDLDYSLQFINNGIKIFQIQNAVIKDLDGSFGSQRKYGAVKSYFESDKQGFRYLYTIRNLVYLVNKNKLVSNNIIFHLNMALYYSLVFVIFMPKNPQGFKKFLRLRKIINNGMLNNMGQIKL